MLKTPDQSPAEPVHERLRRPMGRARWRAAVLALALGVCAIAAATGALTYRYLVEDAAQRGMAALNFHAEAFQGALDKYRILPALMAQRTLVRGIITAAGLAEPTPAPAQSLSGDLLGAHAALTGAAAIAVSDIGGRIVASSVDDLPQLGVGANISARSHFTVAIEGRLGRETVVTHGGRRLYIFSSAVRDRDTVIGAVSVAVDLEKLEQPWALTRDMIVAFERDGVIVLSNRESLRLRRLSDGADGASDTPSRTAWASFAITPPAWWRSTMAMFRAPSC